MTVRISELVDLGADLAQSDILPIVDISASETKQVSIANLIKYGISGSPSSFIDLSKLDQTSTTKLSSSALANTGVTSGTYGAASTSVLFTVNDQGLITAASGVPIAIAASSVTGLAPVALSGTYESLTGLPALGTLASQDAGSIVVSGGTISGVTFVSGNVTISGGTISGIADLAIADGGTGASDAASARSNLGLAIGSNVQAYSPVLSGVASQFGEADQIIYASASGVVSSTSFTSFGRSIVSGATSSEVRTTLGLGSIATQDSNSVAISGGTINGVTFASASVAISGGTISGITDLAIADGGTGASDATTARSNLGLAIGSNVQAYSPVLSGVASQFGAANQIIYASASGVVSSTPFTSFGRSIVSGDTASQVRTTLGLSSMAVQAADSVAISGGTISGVTLTVNSPTISGGTIVGIIDLAIADGGTGASTASGARSNLGLSIGSDVQAYSPVLSGVASQFTAADQIIYASASGIISSTPFTSLARSIVSGATSSEVRTTLGLNSMAVQAANSVAISGGTVSGVTLTVNNPTISGGTIVDITDLAVADGGTGASDAATARTNLGLTIGTNVQAYSAVLSLLADQYDAADEIAYSSASGVIQSTSLTSLGRTIISASTASGIRSAIELGSLALQDANSVGISGGAISGVTLQASSVTISGGTISDITDLEIADGGTGASTASAARTNLGLAIGTDVQAYSLALSNITSAAYGEDLFFYTTASGAVGSSAFSPVARAVVAQTTISGIRNTLGLGDLATLDAIIVDSGNIADDAVGTLAIADESITASKISNAAVSYAKLAPTSQSDVLLGRATDGPGTIEEITCTAAARSILDDATITDIRATLELGTLATQNGTFSGTSTGTNTGDQTIVLTGDVTGTGTGSFAATIATGAVSETKIADSAVTNSKIANGAVEAVALADQSASIVAAASPSASGAFIGQQWINTNNAVEYTWTGTEWLQQSALGVVTISGDIVYSFSTAYPDEYSAIITPALNTQAANRVFIGPASGSDAAPTFRALTSSDLPTATASVKGAVAAGAGLSMTDDFIGHTNSITSGVFYKVEVDSEGHVSSGATALIADDIPALDASKITTGFFGSGFIADDAILAANLANYSTTKFGEALPSADFIGQYFFNPLSKDLYLWDGNVWNPVGVSIGEIVFAGTYNASGNTVSSTTTEGAAVGLTIGQPLPAATANFNSYYVVVESGGTGTSPAPETLLAPPDIILCNGTAWVEIDVSSTYVSQTASQVTFSPAASIGSTNVQAAIEEVSNECRNVNNVASGVLAIGYGGTGQSSYAKGNILVASGTGGFAKLAVGANGTVLTADSAETSGVKWEVPASGTVLSVNATAPLAVVSGTTTPHITISGATTSAVGVVQLTDSTSTTSSTLAATATAVKSAYDVANAALPVAGGTMTGTLNLGTNVTVVFEGSVNDSFETTLTVANPTADRTITLPNVTGTVITTGDSGTVTNTMLAGSIADTKLNTISTAGKVSNSATTATSANTVSAIVARDGSGNFSAGTIDATIDEGTF